MSPNDKKRNDRIISAITLFLLVPLTIVIAIFLATEIQMSSKAVPVVETVVEKGKVLSTEQLLDERDIVPKNTVNLVAEPEAASSVVVDFIDDEAVRSYLNTPTTEPLTDITVQSESFVPDVQFIDVEVTKPEISGSPKNRVYEGSVYATVTNDHFAIVSDVRTIIVNFSKSTPFFINGKRILATDLRLGDYVRVEGVGEGNSISATSVTVIKVLELNI